MTNLDLSDLRAKAEAALAEDWIAAGAVKAAETCASAANAITILALIDRVERLQEIVRDMEGCCERLAKTRSVMTYKYMLSDGQADDLLALDAVRKEARADLSDGQKQTEVTR